MLDGQFDERQVGRGFNQPPAPNPHVVWDGQLELPKGPQLPKGPHLHPVIGGQRAGAVTVVGGDCSEQAGATAYQLAKLIPEVSPQPRGRSRSGFIGSAPCAASQSRARDRAPT